jgi:hypothetical protein
LALVIDVFTVLEAVFSAVTVAISGVSATVALIAKPDANTPSRAMPREPIDERPFADGLIGSVEFVVRCARTNGKPADLLRPGYLPRVHELASPGSRRVPKNIPACTK